MLTAATARAARPSPPPDALRIGPWQVWPPVVLAPMAGITNAPFRALCRAEALRGVAGAAPGGGPAAGRTAVGGLFVCEMVTTRALVERNARTLGMIRFGPGERPRSLQLYGVDPAVVGRAVAMVVGEGLADHVDLNFGCPVPKVTRRGGGAALPYRRSLFRAVVRAAVTAAGGADGAVPVTVKMRMGIDGRYLTYLEAGRIAEEEGAAAVALHARTAAQAYSGTADWGAIARLAEALTIPVLGNGDIWEAADALRMVRETGCAGVVVGRGCLGRPWLFRDLAAAFDGTGAVRRPPLGEVAEAMRRHAAALVGWMDAGSDGASDTDAASDDLPGQGPGASAPAAGGERHRGVVEFRKHVAWYLKGFAVGPELRRGLACASTLPELEDLLRGLDAAQPWPGEAASGPRGRGGSPRKVALPEGWLDDPDDPTPPTSAELADSGG